MSGAGASPSSRCPNTGLGGMDELAAPAAVVTMSIDENDDSDLELEVARSVSVASDVMIAAPDATGVGKENQGDLPVDRQLGAANPKVILRKLTSHNPPCSQPNLCAIAPFVPQAEVSALLLRAEILFPEGKSEPRAAAKVGASAKLTNELVVNAKDAIDKLWKARGYVKMKPAQRKLKLGYALDREEALGYLVTSALHMPLISAIEARTIGKRAGSLAVFSKLADYKKRGTAGSAACYALLGEPAPLSFAAPMPRKGKAKPLTPAPAPARPVPLPSPLPPLPPPTVPLVGPATTDARTEYLHPYGRWCEDGRYRWSDDSILGYRGLPGGDPEERFWDTEKPPCVPSDHRPQHLFTSRDAAKAAGMASRMERFAPDEDGEFDGNDEEYYELARVEHRFALRRLREEFPEVAACPMVHASQHHTRPCPCGRGVLAMWPWVVQTAQLGFCDCWMASWERTCWRSEWIKAGVPNLAY